ncbi:hypothetical protein CDL12_15071 [Handroanthus impetiginosus]|uniref:Retrotransposon gag domain-containing protein n=1 Tax=Handroanthus impetiginosus TaxID=429701 RepID=A0A2G9H4T5_9LAMI|nr:hypothetical protein CDL12_15071 [Handroanthus impetiginosus]
MATEPATSINIAGNNETEAPRWPGTTKQKLEALEDENARLGFVVGTLEEKVETMELGESRSACRALVEALGESNLADMRREMEVMSLQICLLQRAMSNGAVGAPDPMARLRVPEPRAYGGERDAKEVENFLFDIEQYVLAANVVDEAQGVRMDMWALLKEAIHGQFFPENVECNAKRALRELKHTRSIQDYFKAFSTHMLDITDMSEKDKLFTFMEVLKPWARTELQRQRVADVSTAMGAAERLLDYNPEAQHESQPKGGGMRTFKPNPSKGGGERQSYTQGSSQASSNKGRPYENKQGSSQKSSGGCFLYDGPHRIKDCLKKQLLNALACFTKGESISKQTESQSDARSEQSDEEEEKAMHKRRNPAAQSSKPGPNPVSRSSPTIAVQPSSMRSPEIAAQRHSTPPSPKLDVRPAAHQTKKPNSGPVQSRPNIPINFRIRPKKAADNFGPNVAAQKYKELGPALSN